jgi:hypothetical protein
VEIALPDGPALWSARGFALDGRGRFAVGAVGLRAGCPRLALHAPVQRNAAGLPIVSDVEPARPSAHPNGALAVDHLVVLTDDIETTSAALHEAGAELRRDAGRMRFHRIGPLILEVVAVDDGPPRFWGLTFTVPELPAGEGFGEARDAVQPGRRIVTARGGTTPVAFITPRA